jgi:hypothetical protein
METVSNVTTTNDSVVGVCAVKQVTAEIVLFSKGKMLNASMILHCYLDTFASSVDTIAYSSDDILDFLKNAPGALREAQKNVSGCGGVTFTVTVNGVEKRIGLVGLVDTKFYAYMGQGFYYLRAVGIKTMERYIKSAMMREKTLQEEEEQTKQWNEERKLKHGDIRR